MKIHAQQSLTINKYIAPNALLWFRMAAAVTWLTGLSGLAQLGGGMQGIVNAFMLSDGMGVIGLGAWLGTIMLFNVWVLIWPNQKKVLGMVEATDDQKAKINSTIPAGKMGSPDDIATSVVYLASDEAQYVTGQTLHVNGGMAMI